MTGDKITRLNISGFKSIDDLSIPLDGLTVLIGENGSGKSTILDALLILASAASRLAHVPDAIETRFGRFEKVLRQGSSTLRFEIVVKGAGPALKYGFAVHSAGAHAVISDEWLYQGDIAATREEDLILSRAGEQSRFRTADGSWATFSIGAQALSAPYIGIGGSAGLQRVTSALEGIDVQPPFDVRPIWQQKELRVTDGPRWPAPVEPAPRLERFGTNLASVYQQLRNAGGETWERTLSAARLGLGDGLRDIRMNPTGRGAIELELVFASFPGFPLAAESLSDGQLAYLAFIALCESPGPRTVLAIDEPELHLHPSLLARVVWMLEEVSNKCPVILATHSDRLLDALESPSQCVVLCELDEQRRTRLSRADGESLLRWVDAYGGLGRARSEGYERQIFSVAESIPKASV